MTKDSLTVDIWDTAAIERHQREVSDWVFDTWKFPGGAAQGKATGK